MIYAIIPARGGSRRIPRKNIIDFLGKPLIAYSIETAQRSAIFEQIYVSTENYDIAEIAESYGAEVAWRDVQMCQDSVGTYRVVRADAMRLNLPPDSVVCCIYATAPLMSTSDLKYGLEALERTELAKHAIAIGRDPLREAAQFYYSRFKALTSSIPYWDIDTVPVPIDAQRICDINVMEDLERAKAMYLKLERRTET